MAEYGLLDGVRDLLERIEALVESSTKRDVGPYGVIEGIKCEVVDFRELFSDELTASVDAGVDRA